METWVGALLSHYRMTQFLTRALAAVAFFASSLTAQTLLGDLNVSPLSSQFLSEPRDFAELGGGVVLFVAEASSNETSLYRSDGTAQGTLPLTGTFTSPRSLVSLPPDRVVFTAESDAGRELWITDGSESGTLLLADISPGSDSSMPAALTTSGNLVFFHADDGVHGRELWVTDGTTSGTILLVDIRPGLPGSWTVSPSGGTAEVLHPTAPGSIVAQTVLGSSAIWTSDGTPQGTTTESQVPIPSAVTVEGALGNRVIVQQAQLFPTAQYELQSFDPGGAPEALLPNPTSQPSRVFVHEGTAYVIEFDGTNALVLESDGTAGGTILLETIPLAIPAQTNLSRFTGAVGNRVLLWLGTEPGEADLYAIDTNTGIVSFVSDVGDGREFPSTDVAGVEFNGYLYFYGKTFLVDQLWRSDGTQAGTEPFHSVTPFADHAGLTDEGLLFAGAVSNACVGLWLLTGIADETRVLPAIGDGPLNDGSNPRLLGVVGERALYATEGASSFLWSTDGTPAGTISLGLQGGPVVGLANFASTGERAIFNVLSSASGSTLRTTWLSDGTPEGTEPSDLGGPLSSWNLIDAKPFGERFLLVASRQSTGREVWISDGSLQGTQLLADFVPGPQSSAGESVFVWRDKGFWLASVNGTYELVVTDGTVSGTQLLGVNFGNSTQFVLDEFFGFDNVVYFQGPSTDPLGRELWRTDGTSAGTILAWDLNPGSQGSTPRSMTRVGDRLAFLFQAAGSTSEVFGSIDPSQVSLSTPAIASTSLFDVQSLGEDRCLVLDVETPPSAWVSDGVNVSGPFALPGSPSSMSSIGKTSVIATQAVPGIGVEAVVMDASLPAGRLLFDLDPDSSAAPGDYVRLGSRVVCSAFDPRIGRELWSFPIALTGDSDVMELGFGCPGSNGVVPSLEFTGDVSASLGDVLVLSGTLPGATTAVAYSPASRLTNVLGCLVYVRPPNQFAFATADGSGMASYPIPPNGTLASMRFVAQGFALDSGGQLGGSASVTPAVDFVFGP